MIRLFEMSGENELDRGANVNRCGVEQGQRRMLLLDQQGNLGATEDHTLCAVGGEPRHDVDVPRSGFIAQHALAELSEDRLVNERSIVIGRDERLDAAAGEALFEEV